MPIGITLPQRRPYQTPSPMPTNTTQPVYRAQGGGGTGTQPQAGYGYSPDFNAAASINNSINQNNAGNIQAQMDLIQQLQAAQNPQQMMDLVTQLTLAQSAGHGNQTHWLNQQSQFANQQWQQAQNYLRGQIGHAQEGYGLEVAGIDQNRLAALQNAGLSRDQALAMLQAEQQTGQLAYETGMATAGQQRDYGLRGAETEQRVSRMQEMRDAEARGATGALGTRQDWQEIDRKLQSEQQNIQATFDIRKNYETGTWRNLQDKINSGRQLTQREYDMLVEQANKEAYLSKQSAWLRHQQDYEALQNQLAQGGIAYNQNQAGFGYQQNQITNAETIRDLQWQMQMLGLQNPSNMLGLQSQWLQYQNQLANMPYNNLGQILGQVASGLPMPTGGYGSGRPNTPYLPGQYPGGR